MDYEEFNGGNEYTAHDFVNSAPSSDAYLQKILSALDKASPQQREAYLSAQPASRIAELTQYEQGRVDYLQGQVEGIDTGNHSSAEKVAMQQQDFLNSLSDESGVGGYDTNTAIGGHKLTGHIMGSGYSQYMQAYTESGEYEEVLSKTSKSAYKNRQRMALKEALQEDPTLNRRQQFGRAAEILANDDISQEGIYQDVESNWNDSLKALRSSQVSGPVPPLAQGVLSSLLGSRAHNVDAGGYDVMNPNNNRSQFIPEMLGPEGYWATSPFKQMATDYVNPKGKTPKQVRDLIAARETKLAQDYIVGAREIAKAEAEKSALPDGHPNKNVRSVGYASLLPDWFKDRWEMPEKIYGMAYSAEDQARADWIKKDRAKVTAELKAFNAAAGIGMSSRDKEDKQRLSAFGKNLSDAGVELRNQRNEAALGMSDADLGYTPESEIGGDYDRGFGYVPEVRGKAEEIAAQEELEAMEEIRENEFPSPGRKILTLSSRRGVASLEAARAEENAANAVNIDRLRIQSMGPHQPTNSITEQSNALHAAGGLQWSKDPNARELGSTTAQPFNADAPLVEGGISPASPSFPMAGARGTSTNSLHYTRDTSPKWDGNIERTSSNTAMGLALLSATGKPSKDGGSSKPKQESNFRVGAGLMGPTVPEPDPNAAQEMVNLPMPAWVGAKSETTGELPSTGQPLTDAQKAQLEGGQITPMTQEEAKYAENFQEGLITTAAGNTINYGTNRQRTEGWYEDRMSAEITASGAYKATQGTAKERAEAARRGATDVLATRPVAGPKTDAAKVREALQARQFDKSIPYGSLRSTLETDFEAGNRLEGVALGELEKKYGQIDSAGLVTNSDLPGMGASPDGILTATNAEGKEGLVEIKAPRDFRPISDEYKYQVQMQMAVLEKDFTNLTQIVEDEQGNTQLRSQVFDRDDKFYEKNKAAIERARDDRAREIDDNAPSDLSHLSEAQQERSL